MIRAVLLDAHGTLLELQPPAPILRRLLRERFAVEVSDAQAERAIKAEIVYYRRHLHEGHDASSVDQLRGRCAEVLRRALAVEQLLPAIGAGELTELLLASLQFRPYPEVAAALAELRARRVRLVVASNWDASLSQTLRTLGLLGHVDGVVTSAQCGAPKPAPAVFERALSVAGVAAGRAIHVGDSVQEDVAGARAVGITPVLIARDRRGASRDARSASRGVRGASPAVRTVASLAELLAIPELDRPARDLPG